MDKDEREKMVDDLVRRMWDSKFGRGSWLQSNPTESGEIEEMRAEARRSLSFYERNMKSSCHRTPQSGLDLRLKDALMRLDT